MLDYSYSMSVLDFHLIMSYSYPNVHNFWFSQAHLHQKENVIKRLQKQGWWDREMGEKNLGRKEFGWNWETMKAILKVKISFFFPFLFFVFWMMKIGKFSIINWLHLMAWCFVSEKSKNLPLKYCIIKVLFNSFVFSIKKYWIFLCQRISSTIMEKLQNFLDAF
jgi:hypothetical protein